jgi:hypothetical protein
VREVTIAAKLGAPDPSMNARLAVAVEAARKQSVSNDVIARAIKKSAGGADGGAELDLVTFEGMSPQAVPVIVECLTDNRNRTRLTCALPRGPVRHQGHVLLRPSRHQATHRGRLTWRPAIESGAHLRPSTPP